MRPLFTLKLGDRGGSAAGRGNSRQSARNSQARDDVAIVAPVRARIRGCGVVQHDLGATLHGDFSQLSSSDETYPLTIGGKERTGRACCDGQFGGRGLVELAGEKVVPG